MNRGDNLVRPRATRRLCQQPHQAEQYRFTRQTRVGQGQRRRFSQSPAFSPSSFGLKRKQRCTGQAGRSVFDEAQRGDPSNSLQGQEVRRCRLANDTPSPAFRTG